MADTDEEWRRVRNHWKYMVSSHGRVRSFHKKGKILKALVTRNGYETVTLATSPGRSKSYLIHRIVAETFLGPCPDKYVVDHVDGNKVNNHVTNLEYVTSVENVRRAIKLSYKLATDIRREWKNIYHGGRNRQKIYEEMSGKYEVSWQTIQRIVSGKTWEGGNDERVERKIINSNDLSTLEYWGSF